MTNKSIDINQRIPLETLHVALESYLNDTYSDEYILEQLRLHFKGENRLKKSLRIVKKVTTTSPLINYIESHKKEILSALKSNTERNIILISLLNSAFVFSFDLLFILGKLFKAQDLINRDALTREISKLYGGNRALPNAIDSVIPMFLQASLFTRPKPGFYLFVKKITIQNNITLDLFKESYIINSSFQMAPNNILSNPYFIFINT